MTYGFDFLCWAWGERDGGGGVALADALLPPGLRGEVKGDWVTWPGREGVWREA